MHSINVHFIHFFKFYIMGNIIQLFANINSHLLRRLVQLNVISNTEQWRNTAPSVPQNDDDTGHEP